MANVDFSHVNVKRNTYEIPENRVGVLNAMFNHIKGFKERKDWWIEHFGEEDYKETLAGYEKAYEDYKKFKES